MDMATALAELGVTEASIDAETRDRLDRDGYAPLPGMLSAAQLTDLINKGMMFDPCFTDPRMLASAAAAEGSNSTRRNTPGRRPWPA